MSGDVRPLVAEANYRGRIVTARRPHRCDYYVRCVDGIRQGDRYLVATEYPGHDVGWADAAGHPVRWKLCARHSMGRIA